MAERRRLGDAIGVVDESGGVSGREGAEKYGAFFERLARRRTGIEQRTHADSILA